ncbi:MAG: lysophospholipid acyltransferase family protein [Methylacidiphilales bacterium]|nr:lysophospholipid acyltransferase family protein [Candidatus Methylacidiphilales bacterium]
MVHILGITLKIHGTPPSKTCLAVCNHISWHDILVLGSIYKTTFLSKSEVGNWLIIGLLVKSAGTLFIHRGQGQFTLARREIANTLKTGNNVLLFPEGTTTDGSKVKQFFYHLLEPAISNHIPIQPIAIHYSYQGSYATNPIAFIGQDTFVNHLWRTLNVKKITAHITFSHLIDTEQNPQATAKKLHQTISEMLHKSQAAAASGRNV